MINTKTTITPEQLDILVGVGYEAWIAGPVGRGGTWDEVGEDEHKSEYAQARAILAAVGITVEEPRTNHAKKLADARAKVLDSRDLLDGAIHEMRTDI